MVSTYTIGMVGLWHLGEIYSAGLAELGHRVFGISENKELIENFKKIMPPLEEPGLTELLEKHQKAGNLIYTTDFGALRDCNVLWFTFDTPVDDNDEANLSVIFDALERTLPYLQNGVLVAVSSQLPIGTSKKIKELVREKRPDLQFSYMYTPENLRLGDAVRCFLEPGRIVVGADAPEVFLKAKEIFLKLNAEIITMSSASGEMAKHAINAFLATSISFTNDLADVCEGAHADVEDVIRALKSEPRIGPKAYLFAGLGFSGGTLGRDLKALLAFSKGKHITLPVVEAVLLKNKSRNGMVRRRLEEELGQISGKTLAMFGVTYKAGTSTLRRSQPLEIERDLREAGANLRLYDPWAIPEEVSRITQSLFLEDPYEAAKGTNAILIMTPSRTFGELDLKKLVSVMESNIFFDTCNILCDKEEDIKKAGFKYIRIGR